MRSHVTVDVSVYKHTESWRNSVSAEFVAHRCSCAYVTGQTNTWVQRPVQAVLRPSSSRNEKTLNKQWFYEQKNEIIYLESENLCGFQQKTHFCACQGTLPREEENNKREVQEEENIHAYTCH